MIKYKKFLFFIFLVYFIQACSFEKKNDIIEEEKFKKLLIDIHIADAIIADKGIADNQLKNDSLSYYNYILKKHNVSRMELYNTIKYYSSHQDKYIDIYKDINLYFEDKIKFHELQKLSNNSVVWQGKKNWEIPKDGILNFIYFSQENITHGKYILRAEYLIASAPKVLKMILMAEYEDQSKQKAEVLIEELQGWNNYKLEIITAPDKKLKKIYGWLAYRDTISKLDKFSLRNVDLEFISFNNEN